MIPVLLDFQKLAMQRQRINAISHNKRMKIDE